MRPRRQQPPSNIEYPSLGRGFTIAVVLAIAIIFAWWIYHEYFGRGAM